MKFKLDENMPVALCQVLRWRGHDVDSVMDENLSGHPDNEIWIAAQKAERFFITQDLDFADIRKFAPGTHRGLLLIRLNHPSRRALLQRVYSLFVEEPVETWTGCLVIATETKVRVRRST
jgi:predicted nuclease of predicted toxin-antitoxin system